VFGAYCSVPWRERNNSKERQISKFFGTGESFVFRLRNPSSVDLDKPVRYAWVGHKRPQPLKHSQEMFMAAGNDWLTVGGGCVRHYYLCL
jgi:hypothetical protein